jgi:hypothetical protein
MISIVVYFEDPADIKVSINGMPSVDTRTALNQIVNEGVLTPAPCDPFGPYYDSDGRTFFKALSPLFDWRTITEDDLQVKLQSNLLSLKRYLRDSDIDLKCIKGKSS